MHDPPSPGELVAAVAQFLRADVIERLQAGGASVAGDGAVAYQARVAAGMLEIAARELALGEDQARGELARLRALLRTDGGSLPELNRELTRAIEQGQLGAATPGLLEHLWRTTLDKLAVDQPNYAAYRHEIEARTAQE